MSRWVRTDWGPSTWMALLLQMFDGKCTVNIGCFRSLALEVLWISYNLCKGPQGFAAWLRKEIARNTRSKKALVWQRSVFVPCCTGGGMLRAAKGTSCITIYGSIPPKRSSIIWDETRPSPLRVPRNSINQTSNQHVTSQNPHLSVALTQHRKFLLKVCATNGTVSWWPSETAQFGQQNWWQHLLSQETWSQSPRKIAPGGPWNLSSFPRNCRTSGVFQHLTISHPTMYLNVLWGRMSA